MGREPEPLRVAPPLILLKLDRPLLPDELLPDRPPPDEPLLPELPLPPPPPFRLMRLDQERESKLAGVRGSAVGSRAMRLASLDCGIEAELMRCDVESRRVVTESNLMATMCEKYELGESEATAVAFFQVSLCSAGGRVANPIAQAEDALR